MKAYKPSDFGEDGDSGLGIPEDKHSVKTSHVWDTAERAIRVKMMAGQFANGEEIHYHGRD